MKGVLVLLPALAMASINLADMPIQPAGFHLEGFDPTKFGFIPKRLDMGSLISNNPERGNITAATRKPLSNAQIAFQGLLHNAPLLVSMMGPHKKDAPFEPRAETLKPELRQDAIRKKLYFGPYMLPSSKEVNFNSVVRGDSGMIEVFRKTTGPCTNCTILFAQAGLEFENGTEANTDVGGWLHHSILMALGADKEFAGCGKDVPMKGSDAFFGGGNERLPVWYTNRNQSADTGYYISSNDSYMAYFELMNMDVEQKKVYPTITFEWLPGKQQGWKRMQDIWIDLDYCSPTGTKPLNDKAFSINSTTWTSPYSGTLVNIDAHMHDGGTSLEIFKNSERICEGVAGYGEGPGWIERSNGVQGSTGMQHISSMSHCELMSRFEKGDVFHVRANYDFTKHMGERDNKGKLGEVMGLTVMFAALDDEQKP
jgi:hypothetical protein